LTLKRNFDTPEWIELGWWGGGLENELIAIELISEEDSIKWSLTTHGQFIVHSMYVHWSFPRVRDLKMEEL
jgi:hypothetical protein